MLNDGGQSKCTALSGWRDLRRAAHPDASAAYDAVVVGGGPAGLSAALVMGRARRRVLVLDTGRPANRMVEAVGGLLGQTGVSPLELHTAGREQLGEFPTVEVRDAEVVDAGATGDGFVVQLESGPSVRTRTLVLAHGLRYDPPPLPGVEALWGRSVFHCPFCDGWEVRDMPIAVHGNGPEAAASAMFIANWSRDVVLLTDGPAQLGAELAALDGAGVRLREEPLRRLVGDARGSLERIEFMAGAAERRTAMFVRSTRELASPLGPALGCERSEAGTIVTDGNGRTTVPGVFAIGDAATAHSRSVANAIGTGSRAAYAIAGDLITAAAPAPALAAAA